QHAFLGGPHLLLLTGVVVVVAGAVQAAVHHVARQLLAERNTVGAGFARGVGRADYDLDLPALGAVAVIETQHVGHVVVAQRIAVESAHATLPHHHDADLGREAA